MTLKVVSYPASKSEVTIYRRTRRFIGNKWLYLAKIGSMMMVKVNELFSLFDQ